jgi:hypothetical protein
MATQYAFGKIVTDGLVLALDAADRNSYPGSGTTWNDVSGGRYSSSLDNGPTFSTVNGGAIIFDGVNDSGGSTQTGWFSNTSITISTWYMVLAAPSTFSQVVGAANAAGAIYISSGLGVFPQLTFTTAGNRSAAGTTISVNTWYNSVSTWSSGDTIKYYHNGLFLNQSAMFTDTISAFNGYLLARYTSGTYLNVRIAQVSFYNRALLQSEITQNYNAQKSRFNL